MQQDLFDAPEKKQPQKTDLAIAKKGRKTLSKAQADFNKLVKKLEKTKGEFDRISRALDESLAFYAAKINPQEEKLVSVRSKCVKLMYGYYKSKKQLNKYEKDMLADLISTGLDEILMLSQREPDDEIKQILEEIDGTSFDELKQESFDDAMAGMEDLFGQMGFEPDMSEINANMSEEEIARKVKEMHEQFARHQEQQAEQKADRKKTKKQLEREEKEKEIAAARKKSIGSIYKQLAKAFHPDLEADYDMKLQKEELMKQLTVAYENNDLHTLLKLEIEWIQKEEDNAAQLTDDKLGIYNEVLKEQVAEVQQQIDEMITHPRYQYLQRYASDPYRLSRQTFEHALAGITETVGHLQDMEQKLKAGDGVKYIKSIIREYAEQPTDEEDLEEMLNMLMKGRR